MDVYRNYWIDACSEAMESAGIKFTHEQLVNVAEGIEASHDLFCMAFGHDIIDRASKSQADAELEKFKREVREKELFILSTDPCKACFTTGIIKNVRGRDINCLNCNGEGRVRKN